MKKFLVRQCGPHPEASAYPFDSDYLCKKIPASLSRGGADASLWKIVTGTMVEQRSGGVFGGRTWLDVVRDFVKKVFPECEMSKEKLDVPLEVELPSDGEKSWAAAARIADSAGACTTLDTAAGPWIFMFGIKGHAISVVVEIDNASLPTFSFTVGNAGLGLDLNSMGGFARTDAKGRIRPIMQWNGLPMQLVTSVDLWAKLLELKGVPELDALKYPRTTPKLRPRADGNSDDDPLTLDIQDFYQQILVLLGTENLVVNPQDRIAEGELLVDLGMRATSQFSGNCAFQSLMVGEVEEIIPGWWELRTPVALKMLRTTRWRLECHGCTCRERGRWTISFSGNVNSAAASHPCGFLEGHPMHPFGCITGQPGSLRVVALRAVNWSCRTSAICV